MTVSEVLRNKGSYRPQTVQAIHAAAHELGYRPNAAARATRRGRFGNFTLMISVEGRHLFVPAGFLRNLEVAASRLEQRLMIAEAPDARMVDPDHVPRVFRELATDGLIISYCGQIPPHMRQMLERFSIPAVWINDKRDCDAVYPDDYKAGTRATQVLLTRGHRRIVWADHGPWGHYSVSDRRLGYAHAMKQAGFEPFVEVLPVEPADELQAMGRLLDQKPRPTAIVFYGADSLHALGVAAAMRGIRVPQDLSVACFEIRDAVRMAGTHVCRWYWPQDELAHAAVSMIDSKVKRPHVFQPARTIAFTCDDLDLSCATVNES